MEASACSKSESEEMFESDESVDTQGIGLSVYDRCNEKNV
jgi:hypothetical protein